MTIPRSYSDKYAPGQSEFDLFKNKNIDWIGGLNWKVLYIIFVFFFQWFANSINLFSPGDTWTAINIFHCVVTFIFFHWIKGCPDDSTQGEYNGFTLYEQIDVGTPWTATKKFLMLVPTLITWMACHSANYKPINVVVNCGIFLICIIAKIPEMHRVRILGINSTLGIDVPTMLSSRKE